MTVDVVQKFLSLLTLTVNVGTLLLLALLLGERLLPSASRWRTRARTLLDSGTSSYLPLAFLVTLTATLGSLWFSEIVGYSPCKLCWYQRIAIFPLPILLGGILLATGRRARRNALILLPLNLVGSLIAMWHFTIERVPRLGDGASCSLDTPCTVPWFTEYGFVTLSWMSLTVSTSTMLLVLAAARRRNTPKDADGDNVTASGRGPQ